MAEICCGLVTEADDGAAAVYKPSTRDARRRRMEIRRFRFVGGAARPSNKSGERKRRRLDDCLARDCDNASENCLTDEEDKIPTDAESGKTNLKHLKTDLNCKSPQISESAVDVHPKYGVASVCGRRRDMEDAVAVHPSFHHKSSKELHYFAVYDGHGCSHVAMRCRDRLHELVKEEIEVDGEWKEAMERSFSRMDKEVIAWNERSTAVQNCRCELQSPECDAVGSTAVVAIVTPDKIIVANCGDSRAVLARKGQAVALSSDHKPDRPDELKRIQEAGGRVIYWDGARVLGVLAMSRAIGDNYLKPYVSSEPEVVVMDRTPGDDCLILATDGLWDVVSNETACGVASMCLNGKVQGLPPADNRATSGELSPEMEMEMADKACSEASMLLTKLALARHSTDNVSVVVVDLRKLNVED